MASAAATLLANLSVRDPRTAKDIMAAAAVPVLVQAYERAIGGAWETPNVGIPAGLAVTRALRNLALGCRPALVRELVRTHGIELLVRTPTGIEGSRTAFAAETLENAAAVIYLSCHEESQTRSSEAAREAFVAAGGVSWLRAIATALDGKDASMSSSMADALLQGSIKDPTAAVVGELTLASTAPVAPKGEEDAAASLECRSLAAAAAVPLVPSQAASEDAAAAS